MLVVVVKLYNAVIVAVMVQCPSDAQRPTNCHRLCVFRRGSGLDPRPSRLSVAFHSMVVFFFDLISAHALGIVPYVHAAIPLIKESSTFRIGSRKS